MNRLYAVETNFSLTGIMADNRLRIKPSDVQNFVFDLARVLLSAGAEITAQGGMIEDLGDHAMVAGKDADPQLLDLRPLAALHGRQVDGQLLQLAEGAGRFGQFELTRLGLAARGHIQRLTALLPPLLTHSAFPLRTIGKPATVNTTRSQRSARA